MGFNLEDYEPVELRLEKFWDRHPSGRVLTSVERIEGEQVVIRAEVYRDAEDLRPAASGYAHETVTAKGVNSTSHVENCETSAIGRALANCGFAAKGKRASREEMEKAQSRKPSSEPLPVPAWKECYTRVVSAHAGDVDTSRAFVLAVLGEQYPGQLDQCSPEQLKMIEAALPVVLTESNEPSAELDRGWPKE